MITSNIKRKEKNGYGFVKYTSRKLIFTIFEDGSGYTEVLDRGSQIFCSESGKHTHRMDDVLAEAKSLERTAKLLREAAAEMKKYSYNTST
jgi:hypothetical protein